MSVLNPPENQSEHGHRFIVFRRAEQWFDTWVSIGEIVAPDAGTAFRKVVLRPRGKPGADVHGEYRVFPMEGAAHLGAELHLHLRDLDAAEPSERVA